MYCQCTECEVLKAVCKERERSISIILSESRKHYDGSEKTALLKAATAIGTGK